jgi:hypothetical protein
VRPGSERHHLDGHPRPRRDDREIPKLPQQDARVAGAAHGAPDRSLVQDAELLRRIVAGQDFPLVAQKDLRQGTGAAAPAVERGQHARAYSPVCSSHHPRRISQHQMGELREELLADGYELTWEPASLLPNDDTARCEIRPTDAAPVPLAAEISALEAELTARGYTSVLNHYQQAVDGFAAHKYESANGDLRTTLEDLVTRLAEDHTGYQRQRRASQGGAAIAHTVQSDHLPGDDDGALLQGLWKLIHTNGPHPGQSDADEACFRMQVITATARFLLARTAR